MLSDDEQTTLFSLRRGQFFGEIALVLSERRTSSVCAIANLDLRLASTIGAIDKSICERSIIALTSHSSSPDVKSQLIST